MPRPGSEITHPHMVEHLTDWRGRGMPDRCDITRVDKDSVPTINPTTLVLTPAPAVLIYRGSCSIQPNRMRPHLTPVGEATTVLSEYVVSIDASEDGVIPGDILTVTASQDPRANGRTFVIRGVDLDTFQSRRSLVLVDQKLAERGGDT